MLPNPVMLHTRPPPSYIEEPQHRLVLLSLRARYSSSHRHSHPLSILRGELLLGNHHPVVAPFGTIHVDRKMRHIILVQRPVS
jgi:hypothetical protein